VLLPTRRRFLAGLAGGTLGAVGAPGRPVRADGGADGFASRTPQDLTVLDITAGSDAERALAGRFTLFVPNHLARDERVPLLVLFHGLGETGDKATGAFAWVERYGLGTSYARLRRPPIARTSRRTDLLPDDRLASLAASLAARPFRGMVIACPYTPNLGKLPASDLDRYAGWITDVVIHRARAEAPVIPDAAHTSLDGVSLGGLVGLEVFLRRPDAFCAWGTVQGALNTGRLPAYADRLATALGKAPRTSVHLETSDGDPFRDTNQALARLLQKQGLAHDLVVLPGQHDQVFLRESGTLEMLLWHDRRLR
jgi:predicted esterase